MRVLLLTHYFEPEHGAPQRRWRALIERFSAAGCEVDVIAPAPHHPSGRMPPGLAKFYSAGSTARGDHGGTVHRVSFLPHDRGVITRTLDHLWVSQATVRRALKLAREHRIAPDLIVATAPALPTLAAGWWIARRLHLPLIVEMRDAWPDLVSHTPGLSGSRSIKNGVKALVHRVITGIQRHADLVVTTTNSFAAVLESRNLRRVAVVRNGTEPERYSTVGSDDDGHGELRVLYMGTIGRSQGLDVVVRATARLRDEGVPVRVRIVGAGADHARLSELNEGLGCPVDLRHAVLPDDVAAHYRWADTCVVSLRDWEPFQWTVPSKLYELMATGKHLTAILDGEGASIVEESRCGIVVPPGDVNCLAATWRHLVAARGELNVGLGGLAWVERHATYDLLAAKYQRLFEALVEPVRTTP